jgi:hypothetical protein
MRARLGGALLLLLVGSALALKIMQIDIADEGWSACRGEDKVMYVTLANKLDGNDLFRIKLSGDAAEYAPRKEWLFNLGMGVAAVNPVQFAIPPNAKAGRYEFSVKATSDTAPGYSAEGNGAVEVKDCASNGTGRPLATPLPATPTPSPAEALPQADGGTDTALKLVGAAAAVVFLASVALLLKQRRAEGAPAAQPQALPYYYASGYGGQSYYTAYYQQQQQQPAQY